LTRKNELRLFDFSHAQKSGTIRRELLERRVLHGCAALEVLMESHITSAVDVWALGCILFQLMTGELPFRADKLTGLALLAGIGKVIGDPLIDVLTFLKISARYSYLLHQTIRPRPVQNQLLPPLSIEYRDSNQLLDAIFQWDSSRRPLASALLKRPRFSQALPFYELPALRLPETEETQTDVRLQPDMPGDRD
jgi:serine/threonine protein kinase